MKTEVAILHHEYPAHVRERVESKLQQLVKFYDRTVSVRALLEKQHDVHRIELVANVRRGVVLVVDARSEVFGKALDDAIHRMARVLTRHKDRLTEGHRRRTRERG